MYDVQKIRQDFPILSQRINNRPLVYLDNASTSQKPESVIRALDNFYRTTNANVHRGVYTLSEKATEEYEATRTRVKEFINAKKPEEIIFTRNTTESINLIAYTWAEKNIKEGDEILVSEFEHHSNLVPWQQICLKKGAKLKFIPVTEEYDLDYKSFENLLNEKTKLIAISGMSNSLGTVINTGLICKKASQFGTKVLIDAAQSVCHFQIDVQKENCDFLAFSSHKMLGPTGVGVLYVKEEILKDMSPFLYGGDMVSHVGKTEAGWNDLPWRFEAGTPNIADVIALKEAIDYLTNLGYDNIRKHDELLLEKAIETFKKYPEVNLHAPANRQIHSSIISFTINNVHPHDIASVFSEEGVAIRSGLHCTEPLLQKFNLTATARMSFYIYNTLEEIGIAEEALKKTLKIFNQ